jgi:hypothetical protein
MLVFLGGSIFNDVLISISMRVKNLLERRWEKMELEKGP